MKRDEGPQAVNTTSLESGMETQVSSDLEYLVLATDGLWDVVQNEDVISLMRATDEPEVAAVKLTEMAHSRHSSDNITCIVVGFHH
uniref:protein-serine/threonine phosphatase n=1 Tax=Aegilops tauschii subsp. strangulata TaxID=200361 RepID=A0A453S5T2_AEGTS